MKSEKRKTIRSICAAKPLIYLITDGETTAENFTEKKRNLLKLIGVAVETEISLIQIREKRLPALLVYEIVSEAVKLTRDTPTKLLVNDRADIALAAKADGVHLTSRSVSAEIVRRNVPNDFIIGASAHSIEEAAAAKRQAADFVVFSSIFSSPGKADLQGVEKLRAVCERLKPFPILALGGVDATNYAETLRAGASGFAAIRFLNDEENLRKLAADLGS